MTTPHDEAVEPARAPDPATSVETVAFPAIEDFCPFLLASQGGWRSATPNRDHRCTAVDPPAPLATDKQRDLCLTAEHPTCPAFLAARANRASTLAPGLDPRIVASADAARRPVARTTAVVLERPRLAIGGVTTGNVGLYQAVLVALMALAFIAVLITRMSASGSPPVVAPTPSITAAPTATPRPTPTPSPASSSLTPSGSGAPPASGAAPSEAPFRTTYRVKAGDTLSEIAAEFGTTVAAIQELNGLTGSDLRIGQLLKIP